MLSKRNDATMGPAPMGRWLSAVPDEMPKPIYTFENCRFAYQLNWSVALFWNSAPLDPKSWGGTTFERLLSYSEPAKWLRGGGRADQ